MDRRLLLVGVVGLVVLGAYLAWHMPFDGTGEAATEAGEGGDGMRSYGAAILGLLVLAFVAFGMDWQDWM